DSFVTAVERVRSLARQAGERGAQLALENSSQPLSMLRQLLEIATDELEDEFAPPLLCWDPANKLTAVTPEDPLSAAASFSPDELGLFHFKQLRDGVA